MKRYYIIPIFVPHQGCPHDCVFCDQRRITGYHLSTDIQGVRAIIENHLATFPQREDILREIAFYGGSFTGMSREQQEMLLEVAMQYKQMGLVDGIRISTRPDYITIDTLYFLRKYNVTVIELGVQSLDDDVLCSSCRGHTSQDVILAVNMIRQFDFVVGLQMMIGLPGDTPERTEGTAKSIVDLHPDFVRVYPTVVIEGTSLALLYRQGMYTPLSLDEAIERAASVLLIFEAAGICVIRMGLQPTAELCTDHSVIAGPFHPAFRALVESRIAYAMMLHLINQLPTMPNTVIFRVNPRFLSTSIGHKRSNVTKLLSACRIKNIDICPDHTVDSGNILMFKVNGNVMNLQITKSMRAKLIRNV